MYTLSTYPPAFGEPSASPFCVKAMCLLQMSGVDWTPRFSSDPRKAPNAKFPVLRDGSVDIPDSDAIRRYLEQTHGVDFDAGLTDLQKGTSRAVMRMVEEHLYFAMICERWLNDANWAHVKKAFFGDIPKLINGMVTKHIRKQARAQVMAQGMARHSDQERLNRVGHDVEAIRMLLGDQDFLFGKTPTAADASVAPVLAAIAGCPEPTPVRDLIAGDAVLSEYVVRVKGAIYPQDDR